MSLSGVSGFIGSYSPETDSGISSPRSGSTTTSAHLIQEIRRLTERIEQLERRTTTEQISHEPITAPEVVLAGDEAPVVTARGVAGELSSAAMSAATTIVMAAARGIAITLVSTGSGLSELELKQTRQAVSVGRRQESTNSSRASRGRSSDASRKSCIERGKNNSPCISTKSNDSISRSIRIETSGS